MTPQLQPNEYLFHFNKLHNTDPSIPPWVVKCSEGIVRKVHVVDCRTGFNTYNNPFAEGSKGSLVMTGLLELVEDEGVITAIIWPEDEKYSIFQ